jgi:hypothetical protein
MIARFVPLYLARRTIYPQFSSQQISSGAKDLFRLITDLVNVSLSNPVAESLLVGSNGKPRKKVIL